MISLSIVSWTIGYTYWNGVNLPALEEVFFKCWMLLTVG